MTFKLTVFMLRKAVPAVSIFALIGALGSDCDAADKSRIVSPRKDYSPAPATKASAQGKELFEKNNCSLCHTAEQGGGCLAPPLNGVGARRSKEFIIARITAEKAEVEKFSKMYPSAELMPHKRIPKSQSKLIADYLMTLPEPKYGYKVSAHVEKTPGVTNAKSSTSSDQVPDKSANRGRNLLNSKGCMACHSIGNIGGKFAPAFDHIGSRKSKEQIKKQMLSAELLALNSDPEYAERGTVMPPMDISEKESEDIANYLKALK
jgi:Cytochrome c.